MSVADIDVLQVPSELAQMVSLCRLRRPRRILEIGSWQGGTMRVWLTQSPEIVVAVDLDHQREEMYERWRSSATQLEVITGDSLSDEVKERVRRHAPFDWMFIDGDHTEAAVRSDVALALECASPGALLLLHDVQLGAGGEGEPGPRIVLEEFRAGGHEVAEYVEQPYDGRWAHGIGVVWL